MLEPETAWPPPPGRLLDRNAWLALAAFFLLAVVATYPVAWHLTERAAGDGADSNIFIWNHWWMEHALASGGNPYETSAIFWPGGTSLVLHTLSPTNALLAIPLGWAMGAVGAYNALVIASFALCAWAMFLLARDVTGSLGGAALAAVLFGFTPYHYAHALGHLNLVAYYWLPAFVLFFLRHLRHGRRRDAWLGAAMLVGAALTDYALVLMAGMFAFVLFLAHRMGLRDVTSWRRLFAPAWRAALVVSPLAALVLMSWRSSPELRVFGTESMRYSLDALGYFVPTPLSWLYADVGTILTVNGTPTEASVFLGFGVMLLALAGAVLTPWARSRPWLVGAGVFYVLSLGPVLQLAGSVTNVPLPYALMQWIPLMDTLRTPARFAVVVILCVAMMLAFAWRALAPMLAARLRAVTRRPRAVDALVPLVALVILAEAVVLPFPTTEFRIPAIYDGLDPADTEALVELPLHQPGYAGQFGRVNYLAAQTAHGIPLVNGYNAREVDRVAQFMRAQLVLAALTRLELGGVAPESRDIFPDQDTHALAGDLLDARGLRRLMFHFAAPPTQTELREWAFLQTLPGIEVIERTEREVLLRAVPTGNASGRVLLDLGTGGHGLESRDGTPFRWAFADPHVYLDAPGDTRVTLRANITPFVTWTIPQRHVDFVLNGEIVGGATLAPGWQEVAVELPLRAGENVLVLKSREPAVAPVHHGGADTRSLAMGVENVRVG